MRNGSLICACKYGQHIIRCLMSCRTGDHLLLFKPDAVTSRNLVCHIRIEYHSNRIKLDFIFSSDTSEMSLSYFTLKHRQLCFHILFWYIKTACRNCDYWPIRSDTMLEMESGRWWWEYSFGCLLLESSTTFNCWMYIVPAIIQFFVKVFAMLLSSQKHESYQNPTIRTVHLHVNIITYEWN